MASYFSSITSRLERLAFPSSVGLDENFLIPQIRYLSIFNTSWAGPDESEDSILQQVVVFDSADANFSQKSILNTVSLICGAQALSDELGGTGSANVKVKGGAIVTVKVEGEFVIAVFVALPSSGSSRCGIILCQLRALLAQFYDYFVIQNRPFLEFEKHYGRDHLKEQLTSHWRTFRENYDISANTPWGPKGLHWLNRLNPQGMFTMLPPGSYRKLTIKVVDLQQSEMHEILKLMSPQPHGVLVASINPKVLKHAGVIYQKCDLLEPIEKTSILQIYRQIELYACLGVLTPERLCGRTPFSGLFGDLSHDSLLVMDQDDDTASVAEFSLDPRLAIELLHPVTLTNTLLILPLSSTVSGLRLLGQSVGDQMPFFRKPAPAEIPVVEESTSFYLAGANGDDTTRLLVHLPTEVSPGKFVDREYSVVVHLDQEILVAFIYDSSLEELSQPGFYLDLEEGALSSIGELIAESATFASGGANLMNSISSLPRPIKNIVEEKTTEIDAGFFYIIYDHTEHSFQTSLPYLPVGSTTNDPLQWAVKAALFHLHDKLTEHFVLKNGGQVFQDNGIINEHLYKFTSNKRNDWLFYAIRHRKKSIIVIRNYNSKHKKPPSEGVLRLLADSVYDYANLGFLDNLGDDVRLWLENFGRAEEAAAELAAPELEAIDPPPAELVSTAL